MSHDRYFLDRIAEKLFVYTGKGEIQNIPGNYSDYATRQKNEMPVIEHPKKQKESAIKKPEQPTKLKFTYKEQKEYEVIDEVIEKLENEINQIEKDMSAFATDFAKLQALSKEKEAKEEELMMQMERWEYLNELARRIEESKKH